MIKEGALRKPVALWLSGRGYIPVFEMVTSGICDVMAGLFAPQSGRYVPNILQIIAVELKLHDVAGVLYQAEQNTHHSNYSWAAMPAARVAKMSPKTLEKFRASGVGLLSVGEGTSKTGIDVVLESPLNIISLETQLHYRQKIWRRRGEWIHRLEKNKI